MQTKFYVKLLTGEVKLCSEWVYFILTHVHGYVTERYEPSVCIIKKGK